jgi:hypothetical protein
MSIDARLKAPGLQFSPPAAPAAAFLSLVRTGPLAFLTGHLARRPGRAARSGRHDGRRPAGRACDAFGVAPVPTGACVDIKPIAELAD